WQQFRETAHRALDEMVDHLAGIEQRPVWQPAPDAVRARFKRPLPRKGRDLPTVLSDFSSDIKPYVTGNTHPLFMGWVHGAGTPVGMIAEMLAAGLNANCGGRNHIGIDVERQVTRWFAEAFGFPPEASGVFVTGTSMANFLGVLIARNEAFGSAIRAQGLREAPALPIAYTSAEAHGCIAQALELAGIGSRHLRRIPVDRRGAMRLDRLAKAIGEDKCRGNRPFLVVGTAGTVNTGAFDDLAGIAGIAEAEGLWFHVDGAFGALAALSPRLRPRLSGMERAGSIAFDLHKWAHVPYDAGFLLVRDAAAHRRAFANDAAYLQRTPRGLGAGETWPCDLGPDLSRGFRALKAWFTFETLGADRVAASIERCCRVASHIEQRLRKLPMFQVVAPVALNIVCFRVRGASDAVQQAVVMDLQERGLAAPSLTVVDKQVVIRAAIVNHRTQQRHADRFIEHLMASTLAVLHAEQQSP
ncbi:MAG TPA: pyridoxal-dependent decarboxylase, partial [Hyphomicrobiaceae bacterium]|nr:pyridoxal-dependent decarboxylase [Hyphomicrobiaceae bacterium]